MNSTEKRSHFTLWIFVFLGFFLLYVLAPGPLTWIDRQYPGVVPKKFLNILFLPLGWLHRNSKWVQNFYDWYFSFWE